MPPVALAPVPVVPKAPKAKVAPKVKEVAEPKVNIFSKSEKASNKKKAARKETENGQKPAVQVAKNRSISKETKGYRATVSAAVLSKRSEALEEEKSNRRAAKKTSLKK